MNLTLPKIRVATGLYSHWDSVIKVNKKVLKWIKNSKKTKPNKIKLESMNEVNYTLNNAIKKGGKEFLISKEVYNELTSIFPKREMRIGGNGNNMGRTLFFLGLNPLVSYPIRSKKLMETSPNFRVACKNKFKIPKKAIRKDPEYEHIIFEFKNDRHILSWDPASSKGVFDHDFLRFACNSKFTDILILAYAHLLLPKYKKRTDVLIEKLKKKRPKVHLEFGTGCKDSMRYAMEKFSEYDCCDSFGLNERECKIYFKSKSENKDDLIEATLNVIKEYNLKRICIHSSKFAFSISKYGIKKEINALKSACFIASASTGIKPVVNSVKKKIGKYNLCLIKTKLNPNPKILTGLGDSFTAIQAVKSLF
jgi:ADP-dependent phosphofructokinase/glucokinase